MILFVVFLLAKALWVQMDIPGEFRHGYVSKEFIGSFFTFYVLGNLDLFKAQRSWFYVMRTVVLFLDSVIVLC